MWLDIFICTLLTLPLITLLCPLFHLSGHLPLSDSLFLLLCHVSYTCMYRSRFYDRICAIILISTLLYILMCVCLHICVCSCARGGWGLKLAVFFISFSTLPVETSSLTEPESLIWLGWLGNVLPVSLSHYLSWGTDTHCRTHHRKACPFT